MSLSKDVDDTRGSNLLSSFKVTGLPALVALGAPTRCSRYQLVVSSALRYSMKPAIRVVPECGRIDGTASLESDSKHPFSYRRQSLEATNTAEVQQMTESDRIVQTVLSP